MSASEAVPQGMIVRIDKIHRPSQYLYWAVIGWPTKAGNFSQALGKWVGGGQTEEEALLAALLRYNQNV